MFLKIAVSFSSILLVAMSAAGQQVFRIKADSLVVFSNCDTAELVLKNRTSGETGAVLTNKGDGVTEFRKVWLKLNDSLYRVGSDTINTNTFGRNIYNGSGLLSGERSLDGNHHVLTVHNTKGFVVTNDNRPVLLSATPVDSLLQQKIDQSATSPFTGLIVRGTGCDATLELLSDTAGTCNAGYAIDFNTLRPRRDSWLTTGPASLGSKYLLGRLQLQTSDLLPDYAAFKFAIRSDTVYYHDGAYTIYSAGFANGHTPYPVMTINPSFKNRDLGYDTKMPFVQVNGGMFVGFGRNWYYNSRNASDIIDGVDDVPGYKQGFYDTRFSVYADSLPLKIYKLPALKGNAFLTYSPARTVTGNNVAFEYKDSIYEDIRQYLSVNPVGTPSDSALKSNIHPAGTAADKLLRLQIKSFQYKADSSANQYTGLIAQDVRRLLPELVQGTAGNYSIDYSKMVPYLLQLIQQQQQQLNALKQWQQELQQPVARKQDNINQSQPGRQTGGGR